MASSKIKIGARLDFAGIVKASIEYVKTKATKKCKGSCLRSDKSVASNSGYSSVASNSGYSSVASNSGNKSVASNSGNKSVASNSGCNGIAVSWGKNSKCKGAKGSYLVLSEWGEWNGKGYSLLNAQMIRIDGENYKEDTFYILKNGNVVEAK